MINPNTEIFRWGPVPGRLFYISEFTHASIQKFGEKFPGVNWPQALILCKENRILWINENISLRKSGKEAFLKYLLPENSRKEIYKKWLQKVEALSSFQNKIEAINLKKLTNSELGQLWKEFYEFIIDFWIFSIPCELGSYGSEEVLQRELEKYIKKEDELKSAIEILAAPEDISFYQEEEIELAEIKNIKEHQQKYFWLQNSYAGTKVLSENYFSKRKKELGENLRSKTEERIKKVKQEKEKIQNQYHFQKNILQISKAVSETIVWMDIRKKYIFINLHYKDLLLKEIAQRFNYVHDDLLNAWFTEIETIISGENIHDLLLARHKGFGAYIDDGAATIRTIFSEETSLLWDSYSQEKISKDCKEFSGTVASKGKESKVSGKVRIVLDPFKIKNFQKGEILIAPMTSPEYVFLMEKAAAIITDSGGITCHAAIVSREFGLPCIVGTKIATQVLKDGDMVEVDAKKGVVRKI